MTDTMIDFEQNIIHSVEENLEQYISEVFSSDHSDLNCIFRYHLGLSGYDVKKGKRLRPLLTALCAEGAGVGWQDAIPFASAIELVHNFSLIHDDIEDNGETRRGKTAVWKKWGLAKGVNSGDAMFASAFDLLLKDAEISNLAIITQSATLLSRVCLRLTEGQQMDIDFETRENITSEDYFQMIRGKTAALLGFCARMGALIAELSVDEQMAYEVFGENLGIAFQIHDDWLGVWGDPLKTGKSARSDIIERKKSLPVLMGLEKSTRFHDQWAKEVVSKKELELMVNWLEEDGIRADIEKEYSRWMEETLNSLNILVCREEIRILLRQLVDKLLIRES